ncbi:MAG: hypothetical protein K8I30_03770, partial [Anaerolineae bacterium]|nr:hypothetical protein [Anaerolineae bacterium]
MNLDLTELKKPRQDHFLRRCFLITLFIAALISFCGVVAYINLLPFMGIVGGNSCPEWLPSTVEKWGKFHLPPSFSNLQTFCAGMQGWIARAEFDMSPADVDALVDGSHIERPLTNQLDPDDPLYDDPAVRRMTSYLF